MAPVPAPYVVRISRVDPQDNNGWCWVADAPTLPPPLCCNRGYGNTGYDAEQVLMQQIKGMCMEWVQQCR